jgi:hypothetical protein
MNWYSFLADIVVVLHLAYVLFVVVGLAAILLGAVLGWRWIRNFWFRALHFLMIAVVVAESLGGVLCPLTSWEDRLRELAGEPNEPGSFIGRFAENILFLDIPPHGLMVGYCVFGVAVLLALFGVPPRWPWAKIKQCDEQGGGGKNP